MPYPLQVRVTPPHSGKTVVVVVYSDRELVEAVQHAMRVVDEISIRAVIEKAATP